MALGTIPPWLNVQPSDFVRAGSAGAEAGLGAARTALEAESLSQRANQAAAQLSQQERLHAMELQTRKEIAEQNRLREDQQMAIENAYKTAQIGLAKDKIEETKFLAEAKGRAAADQFARESGFADYLKANPKDVMGGFAKFGPRPAVVSALTKASATKGEASTVELPELPGFVFMRQPTGYMSLVKRPDRQLSTTEKISIKGHIDRLEREKQSLFGPMKEQQAKQIDAQIQSWKTEFGPEIKDVGKKGGKKYTFNRTTGDFNQITPVDLAAEPSHDEGS